jgi:outer membrane protein assembly factor BamB
MRDRNPVSRRATLRGAASLGAAGLLGGCGLLGTPPKPRLPGLREDVIATRNGLVASPGLTGPVTVPAPVANAAWPQAGGNLAHLMVNPAAGGLGRVWRADIGQSGGYRRALIAEPIVAGGHAYTMDPSAAVAAFDLRNGERLWRRPTRGKKDRSTNVGGGIAFDAGTLYAVNGLAEVVALDPATGKVRWRHTIAAPGRGAPTIVGDRMFVPTADDQLLALSTKDGSRIWSYRAQHATTSVLGAPSPAFSDGIVVAGFGSGDLVGLHADTGEVAWADSLAAPRGNDLIDLSAVRGLPVIDNGIVYAVSLGGVMLALDLHSGRRVWERGVASAQTPWVAGDWLFVLSTDQQIAAVARADGQVRWVMDLPRWRNVKKSRGPIRWSGPLLASSRLIVAGSTGQVAAIDPAQGHVLAQTRLTDSAINLGMIAASGLILVLAEDGTLNALR